MRVTAGAGLLLSAVVVFQVILWKPLPPWQKLPVTLTPISAVRMAEANLHAAATRHTYALFMGVSGLVLFGFLWYRAIELARIGVSLTMREQALTQIEDELRQLREELGHKSGSLEEVTCHLDELQRSLLESREKRVRAQHTAALQAAERTALPHGGQDDEDDFFGEDPGEMSPVT
jgi:hypothetical protein